MGTTWGAPIWRPGGSVGTTGELRGGDHGEELHHGDRMGSSIVETEGGRDHGGGNSIMGTTRRAPSWRPGRVGTTGELQCRDHMRASTRTADWLAETATCNSALLPQFRNKAAGLKNCLRKCELTRVTCYGSRGVPVYNKLLYSLSGSN